MFRFLTFGKNAIWKEKGKEEFHQVKDCTKMQGGSSTKELSFTSDYILDTYFFFFKTNSKYMIQALH